MNEYLIVNVMVTKSTRTVQIQSFSLPAVIGPSNRMGSTPYMDFTSAAAMLTAGFMTSDPEYIEVAAMFSQAIKPSKVVVGNFTAAVAQIDTFQVGTLTTGYQYKFTLNSTIISYTATGGDTQQSVLAALLSAIGTAFPTNPPVTGTVTGTGSAATLTLTSTVAGVGISYTAIDSLLTHVNSTANHSIVNDIVTLQNAVAVADQFYGLICTSHVASDIEQIAAYVETQLMVFVTATADAGCYSSTSTTDVMSILKGFMYDRTMILYSAQANTNGPDGAWMGYMLPTTPGSSNWAMKTLVGVTADNLTPTQISAITSKNGNVYINVGGNGCTLYGTTPAGDYFDNSIFIDWLASTIQAGIVAVETDPLNLKIPYTNLGISKIARPIRSAFQQGQDQGGLASGWTVFEPDISTVSKADRTGRVLNNIGGSGTLAGAINKINVQVFVST